MGKADGKAKRRTAKAMRSVTFSGLKRPDKPRGAKTAYNYFYEEERTLMVKAMEEAESAERQRKMAAGEELPEPPDPDEGGPTLKKVNHKEIGAKWRTVLKENGYDLKRFKDMAKADEDRFSEENQEYQEKLKDFNKVESVAEEKFKKQREDEEKARRKAEEEAHRKFREAGGMPAGMGVYGMQGYGAAYNPYAAAAAGGPQANMYAAQAAMNPYAYAPYSGMMAGNPYGAGGAATAAGAAGAAVGANVGANAVATPGAPPAAAPGAAGGQGGPKVVELVQRLREQRAALEETTEALMQASKSDDAPAAGGGAGAAGSAPAAGAPVNTSMYANYNAMLHAQAAAGGSGGASLGSGAAAGYGGNSSNASLLAQAAYGQNLMAAQSAAAVQQAALAKQQADLVGKGPGEQRNPNEEDPVHSPGEYPV